MCCRSIILPNGLLLVKRNATLLTTTKFQRRCFMSQANGVEAVVGSERQNRIVESEMPQIAWRLRSGDRISQLRFDYLKKHRLHFRILIGKLVTDDELFDHWREYPGESFGQGQQPDLEGRGEDVEDVSRSIWKGSRARSKRQGRSDNIYRMALDYFWRRGFEGGESVQVLEYLRDSDRNGCSGGSLRFQNQFL